MVTVQREISYLSASGGTFVASFEARGKSASLPSFSFSRRRARVCENDTRASRFIGINHSRKSPLRFSIFVRLAKISTTRAQVITLARLRFVVRQIRDGFVPTIRSNLLSGNSTLRTESPSSSFSSSLAESS